MEPVSTSKKVKDETNLMQENLPDVIMEEPPKIVKKEENKQEKKPTETIETKPEGEMDEQVDMSGMINQNYWSQMIICHKFSTIIINSGYLFYW